MKALVWIAGPRAWENPKPVKAVMAKLVTKYGRNGLMIVEGEAPGVDSLARRLCERNGISIVKVPALWNKRGRGAGPQRNADIAQLGPVLLVAFHFWERLIDHSGTFSAVTVAHDHNIPVRLVKVAPHVAMPSSVALKSPMGRRAREAAGVPEANGQPPKRTKARKRS